MSVSLYTELDMLHLPRNIRSTILLAFMLIAGPLKADVGFTCTMMDVTLRGQCCCEEHMADRERGDNLTTDRDPCCERSVELSVDSDSLEIPTPIEVRFDVDPTPMPALAYVLTPVATFAIVAEVSHRHESHDDGSSTYRITERLRL